MSFSDERCHFLSKVFNAKYQRRQSHFVKERRNDCCFKSNLQIEKKSLRAAYPVACWTSRDRHLLDKGEKFL